MDKNTAKQLNTIARELRAISRLIAKGSVGAVDMTVELDKTTIIVYYCPDPQVRQNKINKEV